MTLLMIRRQPRSTVPAKGASLCSSVPALCSQPLAGREAQGNGWGMLPRTTVQDSFGIRLESEERFWQFL